MASCGSRHRNTTRQHSVEDQALNQVAAEAESRLAIKRAARAEARDIRARELERQKLEEEAREREGKVDRSSDFKRDYMTNRYVSSSGGSRRGSFDALEEGGRDLKKELFELEEKYKKAMMNNAQLDNEKQSLRYQVDLYRDQVDDITEQNVEIQRELKDKSRELELKKREFIELEMKLKLNAELLQQRDELIKEHGFVVVSDETLQSTGADESDVTDGSSAAASKSGLSTNNATATMSSSVVLLSPETVEILESYSGTLDERIQKIVDERRIFEKEVKKLKTELDDDRDRRTMVDKLTTVSRSRHGTPVSNGPSDQHSLDAIADLQRQVGEYKLKLKKAEQEIATLEGNVVRLESQVKRFKIASENLEKVEEELKAEKRRFQKELRDVMTQKQELEMENSSLLKRLERTKALRSVVGK